MFTTFKAPAIGWNPKMIRVRAPETSDSTACKVPFKQRFLSNSHDDLVPCKYVLPHAEAEHVALVKPGGCNFAGGGCGDRKL